MQQMDSILIDVVTMGISRLIANPFGELPHTTFESFDGQRGFLFGSLRHGSA